MSTLSEMKRLAFVARDALVAKKFDEFGQILHQGWELKKQLASGISNGDIDKIYKVARKAGVIGGKITGAGGGGFLLLYCQNGKQDDVRRAIGLRELPFRFQPDGSRIIFDYRSAN